MGGPKTTVRVPILESAAVAAQKLFASDWRGLVPAERTLALDIFGDSVDLDPVCIATSTLSSSAFVTLGNTINVPRSATLDAASFVHEMTHIWQYQTQGTKYISDSGTRQLAHSVLGTKDPYKVDIQPGQSFYNYGAEQQAMIIQKYYEDDPPGWRSNQDVLRMLAEVRRARPLSAQKADQERWWGAAGPPDDSPGQAFKSSRTVPLIRIEF